MFIGLSREETGKKGHEEGSGSTSNKRPTVSPAPKVQRSHVWKRQGKKSAS